MAETVQNPLETKNIGPWFLLKPTLETRTIVQPVGRIGAQIGHVTSKMRMARMFSVAVKAAQSKAGLRKKPMALWVDDLEPLVDESITTIILAVPDSFQLEFRRSMISRAGVGVYEFLDTNLEYGPGRVRTAICTAPVVPSKLHGATDYLELWR